MNKSRLPLVSVIIPTYNRPDLLVRSINSALAQTYTNIELIVVDDNFKNEINKHVINEHASRDDRVMYVANDKHTQGIPGARNQGVDFASGEYIAFLDDDDEWLPCHLEESVNILNENPNVDWLFAQTEEIKNGEVHWVTDLEKSFKRYDVIRRGDINVLGKERLFENFILFPRSILLGCSLIRRGLCENIRFDETIKYMDDLLFKFEAIHNLFCFAYVNSIHLKYYMHDRNASNINPNKPIMERFKANEDMARFYERLASKLGLHGYTRKVVMNALADIYFWTLGYAYLQAGEATKGRRYLLKGFLLNPTNAKYWKTFILRYLFKMPITASGS